MKLKYYKPIPKERAKNYPSTTAIYKMLSHLHMYLASEDAGEIPITERKHKKQMAEIVRKYIKKPKPTHP